MKSVLSPLPVTSPTRSDGVGTRRPSVPPVTQKNLNASDQSTCESASVRILKKMRVYRTHTQPKTAVTITDPMIAPKRNRDRKSTRLNSSHANISYAVFCLKKKRTPEGEARIP